MTEFARTNAFDTLAGALTSAASEIENVSHTFSHQAFREVADALSHRFGTKTENSDSKPSELHIPDRTGGADFGIPKNVTAELVQKNIDTIANLASRLPDQMFPIDSERLPLLKLRGIDKIEKAGSRYIVTMYGARQMAVAHPPVEGIDFDKTISFNVTNDPQTGAAKFTNIQGIRVKGNVLGLDVALPINSIEHTTDGDATFRVFSDLPTGYIGALNVDVAIDKTGQVAVSSPRWQA